MRQGCINAQTPPRLQTGDVVAEGKFFRNLKKEHVAKRYAGDDDKNPAYGYKVHKKHWRYANSQTGPLSVNLCDCMRTEQCSIALQPGGEDYFHVAVIDLAALNRSDAFRQSPLVAQYSPVNEIPNLCHFEIVPRDGTVLQWLAISTFYDEPFPAAAKLPATPQEKELAAAEYAKYRSYFDIRRWVRQPDGTLP